VILNEKKLKKSLHTLRLKPMCVFSLQENDENNFEIQLIAGPILARVLK